jgi:hypothetical protein
MPADDKSACPWRLNRLENSPSMNVCANGRSNMRAGVIPTKGNYVLITCQGRQAAEAAPIVRDLVKAVLAGDSGRLNALLAGARDTRSGTIRRATGRPVNGHSRPVWRGLRMVSSTWMGLTRDFFEQLATKGIYLISPSASPAPGMGRTQDAATSRGSVEWRIQQGLPLRR